jgi:hypothetical protein
MMRKARRLVVALAVSALVAAAGVTAGLAASADTVPGATCTATDTPPTWTACQIAAAQANYPSALALVVTLKSGDGLNDQWVEVSWTGSCGYPGTQQITTVSASSPYNSPVKAPISTAAPVTVNIPIPQADPYWCDIGPATAKLVAVDGSTTYAVTTGSWTMALDYTQQASASATPSPSSSATVPLIKGYHGMCLDDKGNSSANRTEVIIWTCNSSQPAQGWKFTDSELVHNGKCANDQGNGGSGTKVILWACNHAPDETWSHTSSDGEFVLGSTSHGQLCLTDPGHSTANRTQLIVYPCRNTSNQHWT